MKNYGKSSVDRPNILKVTTILDKPLTLLADVQVNRVLTQLEKVESMQLDHEVNGILPLRLVRL